LIIIDRRLSLLQKEKLDYFKNKLLEEREEILKTLNSISDNEPNASLKEYYQELSTYDNHPADIATETFQMQMNLNLKESEKLRLEEIQDALQRIQKGKYGKCLKCGKDIDENRLEILPAASFCIECEKDRLPIQEETKTRPVEEKVIAPPYGRSFKDSNKDYNGFDGEDAWQDVARYNKTDAHRMALDWYDNNMYDEDVSGAVEDVEQISNGFYIEQLEDENREDIPERQRVKKRKNKMH